MESYDECVRKTEESGGNELGVISKCLFNDLMSFHVCAPGLPPCLGHDIFEGFAKYDIMLFLKYLKKKKWFSWEELNGRIENFSYSSNDRRDKPVKVDPSSDKIPGKACQIWTFIRLLPLVIIDKIKEPQDPVWQTFLLLSELVDIVCSPQVNKSYIPYLREIIHKYLVGRTRLFPHIKLRPKHHYLTHYADLMLIFGPLILVWTMRFESKHPFFKDVARKTRNFINVTWTLSDKHELYQSSIRNDSEMKNDLIITNSFPFLCHSYSASLRDAIASLNIIGDIQECPSVNIKGTEYRNGNVVVLSQDHYQLNVKMGQIILILVSTDGTVYVVANSLATEFLPQIRAYEINETMNHVCIRIDNLQSYQSLYVYTLGTKRYVKLHNAIVN
ncbi:uncharacterized protein LOC114841705 [Diachasma alloeum]|uniref:uncharacterized protein LOC114841705 n=1 Tax=Diachasma alloeum TaxID=454923 RepID=UPI0010FB70C0|nr:uncharacterized protein LOC114841705 [Diachasma alloeum]